MAASGLKAPGHLDLNGNLSQNFDCHRSYQIYAIASDVSEKSQKIQCNVFLHVTGRASQKVFSIWTIPDDEKDQIEPLITRFKTYCEGKRNITCYNIHHISPFTIYFSHNQKYSGSFKVLPQRVCTILEPVGFTFSLGVSWMVGESDDLPLLGMTGGGYSNISTGDLFFCQKHVYGSYEISPLRCFTFSVFGISADIL